jgi:CheY-like chemotaxis protein
MPIHVLVVEDDADLRHVLDLMLAHTGHRVTTAVDGHDALAVLAHERPDIVVSDVQMPVMSGLELAARLRAMRPKLPIILMSAGAPPVDAGTGLANAYLCKPFGMNDLIHMIAQLTGASPGRDRTRDAEERVSA